MPIWIAIVLLGIIEGLTEFIPVSSTGHLLIVEQWLKNVSGYDASELFTVVIQGGAVLAVIPLFRQRFHQFIYRWREPATLDYMIKIAVAFIITGAGGLLAKKAGWELKKVPFPIAIALLVGGILFLAVEYWLRNRTKKDTITWDIVIAVGVGGILAAIFPGTSRSGATILLALILGLNRPLATEFSFLVGIPTMLAASGYEIFKSMHHHEAHESWSIVLLGTVVSAIVSFAAVRWLLRFVQTHTFSGFGWYRILAGVLILLFAK